MAPVQMPQAEFEVAPLEAPSQSPKKPVADESEMPDDNPISAMMALKHPEMAKEVEEASIVEMSKSANSVPNRFVNKK